MKPNYTPLKKLNDKSKGCKLKVKVLQKSPPAESPSKRRYQKLVLKDDEGSIMKGTLFGTDIDTYEQALKRNGVYELSDVIIKELPAQYRTKPDEEYQMNLGGRMKIRALDLSECFDEPQYRKLVKIPTSFDANDSLLDLVAAVVFVGEEREESFAGYTQQIRDIILVDHSLSRPLKLVARNRYAMSTAADFMTNWHEGFRVVGFTGIRPNTYRGLSLVTTLSSGYHAEPAGSVSDEVRDWVSNNIALLNDWRAKAMLIYSDTPSKVPTSLASIAGKKANTLWQDDYYWAEVSLKHLQAQDVYYYFGCGNCGKRASGNPGSQFYCYNCGNKTATVESRLILNTNVSDLSGTLKITAYTAEVEMLLSLKADEFPAFSKQDTDALKNKMAELRNSKFLIKVCPNHELSTENVLKWIITAVEPIPVAEIGGGDEGLKLKAIAYHEEVSTSHGDQLKYASRGETYVPNEEQTKVKLIQGKASGTTAPEKETSVDSNPDAPKAGSEQAQSTEGCSIKEFARSGITQLDEDSVVDAFDDTPCAGESQPLEHDVDGFLTPDA